MSVSTRLIPEPQFHQEKTAAIRCDTDHSLKQLIDRSIADLPRGRVIVDDKSNQATLYCDDGLIKIALRNLLANADRHASANSHLRLELHERPGFIDTQVTNEGPAIPEDQSRLLFQKYFRGSQAKQSPGAGLGLDLAKRIAELHGGDIHLKSCGDDEPICFCLPL